MPRIHKRSGSAVPFTSEGKFKCAGDSANVTVACRFDTRFVHMEQEPGRRRRSRWPKEARELVKAYLANRAGGDSSKGVAKFRDLVTRLHELTGYPRRTCLYFARQVGVKDKQLYAEWTTAEQQKLLDLIALYPPFEVAKIMRRTPGAIRGMLYRLEATAQMGREWFTPYTLATALHIRVQEVQKWILLGWLKTRIVETGQLKKHIIDPDDFANFCKQHRKAVVGRRLNADRLDFVHKFVFPPSHVELLPAREQGYKKRQRLNELESAQAGLKFETQSEQSESSAHEGAAAGA